MALFRAGHDEAFGVIHDRYRQRLFAYTRQMLPGSRQDAEDALQDVFVRAYSGLRANDRELALRGWLYRVAHNRCIDEIRRPAPPAPELMEFVRAPMHDPIAEAEQRESLRRLIADLRRLPEQQRSALLMRELGGMSYSELAGALSVSVAAVKSLLVRARVGLTQALEARETACSEIRDELILAHDRGVRPNSTARRHLADCPACRQFRVELRGMSRQFAALVPALGPVGVVANLLGFGGGASGGAAAGGGAVAAGGAAGTGGVFAAGSVLATGAGHLATLLAAAAVTAGGAVEIQHTISAPVKHPAHHHVSRAATSVRPSTAITQPSESSAVQSATGVGSVAPGAEAEVASAAPKTARTVGAPRAPAPAAIKSRADSAATSPASNASGGSSAAAGSGTGGAGAPIGLASTPGSAPTQDTTATGTTSSSSGTASGPASGSSTATGDSSENGATATTTQPGHDGTQSGSPASTSVPVSVGLGPDAEASSAGGGSGSLVTGH